MQRQGLAHGVTIAWKHIESAGGNARFPGQGGQGESEERSGPGWRSRTFRWGNGRPVRPDASKDAGPLLAKRLGMTLRPASAALRAQLQLGRGGVGVVVNKVIPGGWAANNGIEQYDVLIGLGTMPIRRARDLADAETKGGKLLLVRKAKRQTVEVKPLQAAKQPAPGQPEVKPVPSEPKQAPVKKKGYFSFSSGMTFADMKRKFDGTVRTNTW